MEKINLGEYKLFPEGAFSLCPQLLLCLFHLHKCLVILFKVFTSQAPGFLGFKYLGMSCYFEGIKVLGEIDILAFESVCIWFCFFVCIWFCF